MHVRADENVILRRSSPHLHLTTSAFSGRTELVDGVRIGRRDEGATERAALQVPPAGALGRFIISPARHRHADYINAHLQRHYVGKGRKAAITFERDESTKRGMGAGRARAA